MESSFSHGLISVAQAALTDFVNGTDTLDAALAEAAGNSAMMLNELVGEDFYELGVQYGQNIADGMADGMQQNQRKTLDIVITGGKQLSSWEKLDSKQRIGVYRDFIGASSQLSQQFMEDNKGVRSALVVMDTAAAITRAYAESNFWVATGQAVVLAANGIVQLNNIKSAGKGGGNISSGGGSATTTAPPQDDFLPETSSLELSDSSAGGSQSIELVFGGGGSPVEEAIIEMINTAVREGRA